MNTERDAVEDLLTRAARGFERDSAVLSGDDERVERIERAVQRRYGARAVSRVGRVALAVAVGLLLAGAALAALGVAGLLGGAKPSSTSAAAAPSAATSAPVVRRAPELAPTPPAAAEAAASAADEVVAPEAPSTLASAEPASRAIVAHGAAHTTGTLPGADTETPAAPVPPEAAAKRFDDQTTDTSATAVTLFAAANHARISGNFAQAATLSQELLSKFPHSAEAISTHLSLGMLKLQQGRAAEALTEFQAYEQQGAGATLAEALWGKSLALQKLGRVTEERAALTELLAKYPRGAYTAAAQKRLALLP